MSTNKQRLLDSLERRKEVNRLTITSANVVKDFYEECGFDFEKITPNNFLKFIQKNKVKYRDAVMSYTTISAAMAKDFGIKDTWKLKNKYEAILDIIDIQKELELYINVDEWNDFSKTATNVISARYMHEPDVINNYISFVFYWYGSIPRTQKHIHNKDVRLSSDGKSVEIYDKDDEKLFTITDEFTVKYISDNKEQLESNPDKEFFKAPRTLEERKIKLLYEIQNGGYKKIVDMDATNLFVSGMLYRIHQGIYQEKFKSNAYLLKYYNRLAQAMYGN